jgi:hypothetical protein
MPHAPRADIISRREATALLSAPRGKIRRVRATRSADTSRRVATAVEEDGLMDSAILSPTRNIATEN